MSVIYITSDQPAVGKTALAGALALGLQGGGRAVGYFKPFSPNPQADTDVDFLRQRVLAAAGETQPLPSAMPEGFDMGQALPEGMAKELGKSLEKLDTGNATVLVEGPSLFTTEHIPSPVSSEVAAALEAGVVLVVRYRPGLNVGDVLEVCEPFGQRLLGVLINCVTRYRERQVHLELAPAMEAQGVKFLGALPEDQLMSSVTVGQMAQHLDGRWVLGEEGSEELVENFLIGGNIMDRGTTYFGRKDGTAVIVRGDRPDIQLAALSVHTTCLVLTGGHEPIQYVYYQAEQQGVPLLVVQTDTISTAHALDSVPGRSTIHHPRKLQQYQKLANEHGVLAAIEGGL